MELTVMGFAIVSLVTLFFAHQIGWKKGKSAVVAALLTGVLSAVTVVLVALVVGDVRMLFECGLNSYCASATGGAGWGTSFALAIYFFYALGIALAIGFFSVFVGYVRYRIAPPTFTKLSKTEKFLLILLPAIPVGYSVIGWIIASVANG